MVAKRGSQSKKFSFITLIASINHVPNERLKELDGLRGILAALVMIYHTWAIYNSHILLSLGQTPVDLLLASPFRVVLAGWQFVLGFFILSGLSLTLPVLAQGEKFNWRAYYASRFIRLYLPVVASIMLAVLLIILLPHPLWGNAEYSWVQHAATHRFDIGKIFGALVFTDTSMNSPLWSLRWEILFSALLPLILLFTLGFQKRFKVGFTLLSILVFLGVTNFLGSEFVFFMATFALGIWCANNLNALRSLAHKTAGTRFGRLIVYGGMALVVSLFWLSRYSDINFTSGFFNPLVMLQTLAAICGMLLLLWLSFFPGPNRFFRSKPLQFLGKISFSLYLTHVLVLGALSYTLPSMLPWWLHAVIAVSTCLAVAYGFWRGVEKPVHGLAKYIKRQVEYKVTSMVDEQG